jgi:signal transduction histidine kinase
MPSFTQPSPTDNGLHFFQGGGEMGDLMRNYPWEEHPLGPPDLWPQSLKTNIRLLLNSDFPMFIWWSKELYAFHNDAYLPALGDKHPQALGTPARKLWAEIWKDIGNVAEEILQGGKSFYAEELKLFLERKGFAEETYWTFSYSPAFNDLGQVEGVFCACFEVTSTVLSQRRLQNLKDVADGISHLTTLDDACRTACDILAQNASDSPFCQIYLLNRQETEAKLCGSAGTETPEAAQVVQLQEEDELAHWPLAQALRTRQAVVAEQLSSYAPPQPEAGEPVPVRRFVVLPLFRQGQDQMLGFLISGISADLPYDQQYQNFHELVAGQIATSIAGVRAREETIRQQADLVDLFEQVPVAVCILRGPQFVVDLANPGICRLWRKKYEDVIGRPILEALPEISNQNIIPLLENVFTTGEVYVNNEMPVVLENEGALETVYFSFVYHPLRNARGLITGVVAVAIEINEQVEARQEIEAMNRELLAVNADLDNFVYSASHDLKAPISNIEGLLGTLVEYLPEDTLRQEVVQRVLSLMRSSVDRFKRSVADLTDVARIQREDKEEIALVNLPQMVEGVMLDFEKTITDEKAQVAVDFAPDSIIRFSAKNARSIFYNLFSNALKYHAADRAPQITVKTEVTLEHVVLSVSDNGLGIKETDKDKIFYMFKRLHDHVEGTGIGLYIVKRIVENAGGRIEVDSEVDKGTTFKVYFKR